MQACVGEGAKPAIVTLMGNVIVGMFLVLPAELVPKESMKHDNQNISPHNNSNNNNNNSSESHSLQQQGFIVFKAMLYEESELCIPHLHRGTQTLGDDLTSQRKRVAAVELLGALVGEKQNVVMCTSLIKLYFSTIFYHINSV